MAKKGKRKADSLFPRPKTHSDMGWKRDGAETADMPKIEDRSPKPKYTQIVNARVTEEQKKIMKRYQEYVGEPSFAEIVREQIIDGFMASKLKEIDKK